MAGKGVQQATLGTMAAQLAQAFAPPGSGQGRLNTLVHDSAQGQLANEIARENARKAKGARGGVKGAAIGAATGFVTGGPAGAVAGGVAGGLKRGPTPSFGDAVAGTASAFAPAATKSLAPASTFDPTNTSPNPIDNPSQFIEPIAGPPPTGIVDRIRRGVQKANANSIVGPDAGFLKRAAAGVGSTSGIPVQTLQSGVVVFEQ